MISEKTFSILAASLVILTILAIIGLLAREFGSRPRGSLPFGVQRGVDTQFQVVCYTRAGQGISCLPCSSLKDGVCPSN